MKVPASAPRSLAFGPAEFEGTPTATMDPRARAYMEATSPYTSSPVFPMSMPMPTAGLKVPSGETSQEGEEQPTMSARGIHRMYFHRGRKHKIGRGIDVEPAQKYQTFGKYLVHIPSLKRGVFAMKYKSLVQIPKFTARPVSLDFIDIIRGMLRDHVLKPRDIQRLSKDEQRLLHRVLQESGLDDYFGIEGSADEDDFQEELRRFELIRGQVIAGQNAPQVLKELKGFILKFMQDGRLRKTQAMDLLAELSLL